MLLERSHRLQIINPLSVSQHIVPCRHSFDQQDCSGACIQMKLCTPICLLRLAVNNMWIEMGFLGWALRNKHVAASLCRVFRWSVFRDQCPVHSVLLSRVLLFSLKRSHFKSHLWIYSLPKYISSLLWWCIGRSVV